MVLANAMLTLVLAASSSAAAPLVVTSEKRPVVAELPAQDRGVLGYLRDAFVFGKPWSPTYDLGFLFYSYICLQFCEFGGQLWMPRLYYGDVPDNAARRTAIRLGILATVLAYIPTWFPIMIPGIFFLGLGIPAAFLFNLIVHGFIFPRAIAIALGDAERMGPQTSNSPPG